MDNGISLTGTGAFAPEESIEAAGKELRKLIRTAYDAHLDQATIVRLIDAFTKNLSSPGLTDCSVSEATITDRSRG